MKKLGWLFCVSVVAVSCRGRIQDSVTLEEIPETPPHSAPGVAPGDAPGGAPEAPPSSSAPLPGTDTCRPPAARLWPLSPQQLGWTLAAALPSTSAKPLVDRFRRYAAVGDPYTSDPTLLNGSLLFVNEFMSAVRVAVDATLASEQGFGQNLDEIFEDFGARLYRRPLTTAEMEGLQRFYELQGQAHGPEVALSMTLRRMVGASDVLFRSEMGAIHESTEFHRLNAFELASQVAYTLTDAPPDDALWAAAVDGSLLQPEVHEAHVRRLLDPPPSADDVSLPNDNATQNVTGVLRFFREWLDVDQIRLQSRPDLPVAGRRLRWFDNETMLFLRHILWEDEGTLTKVLTSESSIYSNTLADHYGYSRDDGYEVGQIRPVVDGRRGLLMHAGFLTSHDGATARGLFIRERLLCQPIFAPPTVDMNLEGLEQALEESEGTNLSPREVRQRHLQDPACAGCHLSIDPLGFPFDNFDDSGLIRAQWDGFDVDTRGEVLGTATIDGPVNSAAELVDKLATAPEVRDCFVVQLYSFVHGAAPTAEDGCYLDRLQANFHASGGNIRELLVDMMTGEEMRFRTLRE